MYSTNQEVTLRVIKNVIKIVPSIIRKKLDLGLRKRQNCFFPHP